MVVLSGSQWFSVGCDAMSGELHVLAAARLRHDGQRYTSNRRGIVEVLESIAHPLTIPEIIDRAGDLAQSSVYRHQGGDQ
jgi:Fe2+ or Zn2+ uptake regulation protein